MDGQALWEVGTLFKCGMFYFVATLNLLGTTSGGKILTLRVSRELAGGMPTPPLLTSICRSSSPFFSPSPFGRSLA